MWSWSIKGPQAYSRGVEAQATKTSSEPVRENAVSEASTEGLGRVEVAEPPIWKNINLRLRLINHLFSVKSERASGDTFIQKILA